MYQPGGGGKHPGQPRESASSSGTYHLDLNDVTPGQSFAVAEKRTTTACADNSAEAITEGYATTSENGTSDLCGLRDGWRAGI
jgi:hypothetical protein